MIQLFTQFLLPDILSLNTKKERHYFVRARAAEGILRRICLPFLPLSEKELLDMRGTRHGTCWVWSVKEMGSKVWKGRLEQSLEGLQCVVTMFGLHWICSWRGDGRLDRQGRGCVLELGGPTGLLRESWWSGGSLHPTARRGDGELPRLGTWLDRGAKWGESQI